MTRKLFHEPVDDFTRAAGGVSEKPPLRHSIWPAFGLVVALAVVFAASWLAVYLSFQGGQGA